MQRIDQIHTSSAAIRSASSEIQGVSRAVSADTIRKITQATQQLRESYISPRYDRLESVMDSVLSAVMDAAYDMHDICGELDDKAEFIRRYFE